MGQIQPIRRQWSQPFNSFAILLHRAKFHETAAEQIRKQLQLLKAELPLPPESDSSLASMAAAGFGSHVLEDDQCDDDEGDQFGMYFSTHHPVHQV